MEQETAASSGSNNILSLHRPNPTQRPLNTKLEKKGPKRNQSERLLAEFHHQNTTRPFLMECLIFFLTFSSRRDFKLAFRFSCRLSFFSASLSSRAFHFFADDFFFASCRFSDFLTWARTNKKKNRRHYNP